MITSPFRALERMRSVLWLLAVAFGAGISGAAAAQDCPIKDIPFSASHSTLRARSDFNFACLAAKIEALRAEREAMASRIESLEADLAVALAKFRNRDGAVDRDAWFIGPATFVLSGDRMGNPTSLKLDRELLLAMCGDAEGCLVQLGLEGIVVGGEEVETRFSRGPCAFHFDRRSGAWALSGLCAGADLPTVDSEARGAPGGLAPGPAWGRSGDAAPIGGSEQDGRVIVAFGGACLLAEAPPERHRLRDGRARLQRDTARDLFLVAAGARWNPDGRFPAALLPSGPADPPFRCRLTLRD